MGCDKILEMSKVFLDKKMEGTSFIYFTADEVGFSRVHTSIDRALWKDLGYPDSITVAIKAGNDFDFS